MLTRIIARLFTLICLLISILAFGLITAMQQPDRPAHTSRADYLFPASLKTVGVAPFAALPASQERDQ